MTRLNHRITYLLLAIGWMLIILWVGGFRPTYIVEGAMNHFNFEFASKEAYGATVQLLRWAYRGYLVGLVAFTVWVLGRWQRPAQRRR